MKIAQKVPKNNHATSQKVSTVSVSLCLQCGGRGQKLFGPLFSTIAFIRSSDSTKNCIASILENNVIIIMAFIFSHPSSVKTLWAAQLDSDDIQFSRASVFTHFQWGKRARKKTISRASVLLMSYLVARFGIFRIFGHALSLLAVQIVTHGYLGWEEKVQLKLSDQKWRRPCSKLVQILKSSHLDFTLLRLALEYFFELLSSDQLKDMCNGKG